MPTKKPGALKPVALKPLSKVDKKTHHLTIEGVNKAKEELPGGVGDFRPDSDFDAEQLKIGTKIEFEHTHDKDKAKEIAKDHLTESPDYYKELKVMEDKLEDKGKEKKSMNKSLQRIQDLAKALKASAALSLSRRARAEAAVADNPSPPAFGGEFVQARDIGVGYTRPLHEPPVVPVRRVETPNPIPARKCEDHVYKTRETGPQEAKPIKDR